MNRIIREARLTDMAEIMKVMDAAKEIMRQSGNMHQWGEGYPSEAVIFSDIKKNGGFVIEDDCKTVGYFAFLASPEPTYAEIYEGQWLDDCRQKGRHGETPDQYVRICMYSKRAVRTAPRGI